jgi:hypothetical protein
MQQIIALISKNAPFLLIINHTTDEHVKSISAPLAKHYKQNLEKTNNFFQKTVTNLSAFVERYFENRSGGNRL